MWYKWTSASVSRSLLGDVCDAGDGEGGPTGLMGGTETTTSLAVEIFVEKDEIAPVLVGGKSRVVAVARAVAIGIGQEDARQTRARIAMHSSGIRVFRWPSFDPVGLRL